MIALAPSVENWITEASVAELEAVRTSNQYSEIMDAPLHRDYAVVWVIVARIEAEIKKRAAT